MIRTLSLLAVLAAGGMAPPAVGQAPPVRRPDDTDDERRRIQEEARRRAQAEAQERARRAAMEGARADASSRPARPAGGNRITFPADSAGAVEALNDWLEARGFEPKPRKDSVAVRRNGILMHIRPIIDRNGLSRLRVIAYFGTKDEFRKSAEFEQQVAKVNRAQNFLQIWADDDGDLVIGSNLTFDGELTARLFDAFVDSFVTIARRHVFTDESLRMLK